jgi:serine/threonine-protein kinase
MRMTGRRLGPWVIDAEIGRGAMGTVYRAHQADNSANVVALKILNADLARDDVFVARFQREIEALRQLDHPNIVHFLEAGSDAGLFFYAMEYVAGRDCEAILRERGRLPWPEVLDLALQVVPALKHAHDRGIIHRDLKPANIMLAGDAVKLTDFGVAKLFARPPLTAAGSFVGTAAYLAPEQAVG